MREIKDDVLRMGSLVEEAIRAAIGALIAHDAEAATAVIVGDGRINEVQREVSGADHPDDRDAVARSPATCASCSRSTTSATSWSGWATTPASVAKQARKLAPEPPLKRYVDLPAMGELAAQPGRATSCGRWSTSTRTRPARSPPRDDEIDDLYHRTFDEVVELMRADPDNVERGTRILFAAHYLERIGDRVTNIAEDVVFLASGEIEDLNP